jgi:TonB family protein
MKRVAVLVVVAMSAILPPLQAASIQGQAPPPAPLTIDLATLNWPEIKDADALVALARTATAELKASGQARRGPRNLLDGADPSVTAQFELIGGIGGIMVHPEYIGLSLRTHPVTGQVLLVVPEPTAAKDLTLPKVLGKVEDTTHPHIKRAILREPPSVDITQFGRPVTRWKDFKNLDRDHTSTPWPQSMQPPAYPMEMVWANIEGTARLEFTVTKEGAVTDLVISASHTEFEPVVRDAVATWRFEPGVDFATRRPVETRMTLTVVFSIPED